MEKQIKVYNGKVFGFDVSECSLENGYLDYYMLSKIVGNSVLKVVYGRPYFLL